MDGRLEYEQTVSCSRCLEPLVVRGYAEGGADEVRVAEHHLLEHFTIDAYSQVVNQALLEGTPSIFLLGATPNGRDQIGRASCRERV